MFRAIMRLIGFIHRNMFPIDHARRSGVRIGERCRLVNVSFGSEPWLVQLGDHVSLTEVSFVTHDGGVWVFRDNSPEIDVLAPILIGNNVFVGSKTVILPGVTIGNNVVIGAGSVVTRDIPDNSVAAGVPAKVIRSLDEYRQKVIRLSKPTKGMKPDEKRRYYEKLFFEAEE